MKVALAQVQSCLGDFDQNCKQVLDVLKKSQEEADLIVFPEGGLWGYPPKDFLYQNSYFKFQENKFLLIKKQLKKEVGLLLPCFIKKKNSFKNGIYLFEKNKPDRFFAKEFLPDKNVFFESRYFKPGVCNDNYFYWKNKRIQLLICEDLWQVSSLKKHDLLICVNSSPYTDTKQKLRLKKMKSLLKKYHSWGIYLNRIGGQDNLIFDGGSFVLNNKTEPLWQGKFFKEDFKIVQVLTHHKKHKNKITFLNLQEQRKQALILGIQDFCKQTGFSKVHLGLSGGMDSALVTYLACEALGNTNVKAYFLPSSYTNQLSYELVKKLSDNLNIELIEKSMQELFKLFSSWFFEKRSCSNPITLQNIQSRIRTLILMAEANESSSLLLATSNKSELATGYSTLYGDLAGALCPIGDLFKTQIYKLAQHINKKTAVFPDSLFLRAPSAELAPNQKDSDELLPYSQLDPILEKILKNQCLLTKKEKEILQLVRKNEFKRQQAPLILKISDQDLGESRKQPIANKFSV